jgi:hypothetical protein
VKRQNLYGATCGATGRLIADAEQGIARGGNPARELEKSFDLVVRSHGAKRQ